jgi:glyoxylase-like metal-dependent hydrolase (beta-lactamase superfamily II)
MPKVTGKSGKPTATFEVQVVQESEDKIVMYLHEPGHTEGMIVFKRETGTSGPRAFGRLQKIIDKS